MCHVNEFVSIKKALLTFRIHKVLYFFLSGFSLLYAVNNNPFTEIRKISLEDDTTETTLVSWRRAGDFAGFDYDYQNNCLYWADSFFIYRSLLGKGKQGNIFILLRQSCYTVATNLLITRSPPAIHTAFPKYPYFKVHNFSS